MVEYKNSTNVLIFNDAGELALQLRSANDDLFPSYWDFSAGGGIDEGEDSKLAAEREAMEELGIQVTVEPVGEEHFQYPGWDPSVIREVDLHIFKARHNGPFKPDLKEVDKVQFFSLNEIQDMIDSGAKFHPEFLLLWKKGIIQSSQNYAT